MEKQLTLADMLIVDIHSHDGISESEKLKHEEEKEML
jgi:hypothetical protein